MRSRSPRPALLFATALSLTGIVAHPAHAGSTGSSLDSIEQQIKSLQAEVRRMKAEAAQRNHELRAARATPPPSPTQIAPVMPQIPAGYALVPAAPGSTPGSVVLARAEAPKAPRLPQGTFQIGALNVTLGGFFEAASIYRSRNEVTDITSVSSVSHDLPQAFA